jgi:NADH-quinone oxidoreductase subunit J
MISIFYLQVSIIAFILVNSVFLVTSKTPVYSVFFLILIFFGSAVLTVTWGVDYIGLLFVIIYVGAIAVLFLFVIMMLDLKIEIFTINKRYLILMLTFFFLSTLFSLLYSSKAFFLFDKLYDYAPCLYETFDPLYNIDVFGQSFFNNYIPCFLCVGFVLLTAMLGAIVLTLKYNTQRKNELFLRQLSRSETFLSFIQ